MSQANQENELNNEKKSILDPPANVSGMKELDRHKFDKLIKITCLKVQSKDLKSILKLIKPYLLKKQNFAPIIKLSKLNLKRKVICANLYPFFKKIR